MAETRVRPVAALAALVLVLVACGTRLDREQVQARRLASGGSEGVPGGQSANGSGTRALPGAATGPGAVARVDGRSQGGGGTGARGGTAAAFVYDQGISDTEIVIGVTASLSGILGFIGEETVGPVDAYFKLINSKGGVDGRKLRLISYDDRADPAQTLANVKRLVEQDKVFMVFAAFGDSPLEYVRQRRIPMITGGPTAPPSSSKYPTVFPMAGNGLQFNQEGAFALVNHAKIRPKRVGILYDTTIFDARGYVPFFKETWERLGAEVVSADAFNISDGDCTSLAVKMRGLEVDFWDFEGLGWLLCMSAMERIGWRPSLGMGGWPTALPEFGTIVGPSIEGVWSPSTADQPDGDPRTKTKAHTEYAEAMKRFHPSVSSPSHLESPQQVAMWAGARMVVDALRAIGPTYTRDAFIKWMHGVRNYEVGIMPPIRRLSPNCKAGAGGTWWAHYQWDEKEEQAVRQPETPYVRAPFADEYGGECFSTKIADQIVGR